MLHKMVTLCPASHDIAKRMKNFSLFVRRATLATEEGGLELVEPSQIPPGKLLALLLAKEQKANGFETEVGLEILKLHQHFKNI
jgi:hypothetical protein